MVVGNGMIAKSFAAYNDNENVLIFASGVSNSKLKDESEFIREVNLLKKMLVENKEKQFIYFSTFNLYDPIERDSAYCKHKLRVENYIKKHSDNYIIFRLGHVAGISANQITILNFLYNTIASGHDFKLWKYAARNIIDIDDITLICSYIVENKIYKNEIINVCNTINTKVSDLVKIFESILQLRGKYSIVEDGGCPDVDNSKIHSIAEKLSISFDEKYVENVLLKYFKHE